MLWGVKAGQLEIEKAHGTYLIPCCYAQLLGLMEALNHTKQNPHIRPKNYRIGYASGQFWRELIPGPENVHFFLGLVATIRTGLTEARTSHRKKYGEKKGE